MKKSTRKKVLNAVHKRLANILGVTIPQDLPTAREQVGKYMRRARGSAEVKKRKTDSRDFEEMVGAGIGLFTWTAAERDLIGRPEPTPQQLKKFLSELQNLKIDSVLRSSLKTMYRKLPPFPPGKAPSLKRHQQDEALAELHRLTTSRQLNRKAAYAEVAKKYNVHWRTIQNAYLKSKNASSKGETI